MSLPIALQLFTIREAMKNDFEAALKQVAEIGYEHVELAGLGDYSPEQAKTLFEGLGLKPMAAHENLKRCTEELDATLAQAKTLGYDLVICPVLGEAQRTAEGFREAARLLSESAAKAKGEGITIAYHNHAYEFDKLADESTGMAILTKEGQGIEFELDLFWVAKAGQDPFKWMRKLAGRLPTVHVKDMTRAPENTFAEVGTGVLDLRGMVAEAAQHGVRYLVVEQDRNWIDDDPIKSAKISYDNLSTWPS
ncbi:MAG: sugar phosphate isomerase/epimerase [Phycisphaeraceae bacterium]